MYRKCTAYLTLIPSISRLLGVAAFSAVRDSSSCNGHGLRFCETPMPSDGCRSTIFPTINLYRVSRRHVVSFGSLFGLVLGHVCHFPSSVLSPDSNYPILTHFCLSDFVSNFAEYSCLIVGRCVQCYFAFWLTFYWSLFNLHGYCLHEKMGRYKKVGFVKKFASIRCRSTIYPTINLYRIIWRNMMSFGSLFGLVLGHGSVTIRRRSFSPHSNYPILTHFCLSDFVSNFAEYSCLIVARCVQCYFAFWLTFYWPFFNLHRYSLHEKWGATKKLVSLTNVLQFDALAAYIQQSTRTGSSDKI